MTEKVYFYLFILCTILAQSIIGTFLNEDIGESSDGLVRRKRVINRISGGENLVETGIAGFIVNIKKNRRLHCTGNILARRTVITAARCVPRYLDLLTLTVVSGSIFTYSGQIHSVVEKKLYGHDPPRGATLAGISLLIVHPAFDFSGHTTYSIGLNFEPVVAGMIGTVNGWGTYAYGGARESSFPQRLRSIRVPIMSHRECVNIYHGIFRIEETDFCTYHAEKQCAHTDAGTGFIMHNKLVGIHIGAVETEGRECRIKPDVYVLLQNLEISAWIRNQTVD